MQRSARYWRWVNGAPDQPAYTPSVPTLTHTTWTGPNHRRSWSRSWAHRLYIQRITASPKAALHKFPATRATYAGTRRGNSAARENKRHPPAKPSAKKP